jgi:hypothetical protein
MFGKHKRQRNSRDFWVWLATNTARIQSAGRDAVGDIAGELDRAFKTSHPDLVWEITPSDSGPWCFCVSADGTLELFDQVKSAVAAAPPIPGWEIQAFRQRGSLDAVIEVHDRKLGYDDIWCEVAPDGTRARVTLRVRGLTLDSAEALLGAALVLLDNAVGEHDSVVRISELDNGPMPAQPVRSATFFPLSELPGYLDRLGGRTEPDF